VSLIDVDLEKATNKPAVWCHKCGREGGLTLNADGRFECRGWCGRMDIEISEDKRRRR